MPERFSVSCCLMHYSALAVSFIYLTAGVPNNHTIIQHKHISVINLLKAVNFLEFTTDVIMGVDRTLT